MYQLMVKRDFIAQHYLTVPDCGAENEPHSHAFTMEVLLQASVLDQHGYLVDIDRVKSCMEQQIARYTDCLLNDLPEFAGLNPSVEHFAAIICHQLAEALGSSRIEALTVRLWEDDEAWASFTLPGAAEPMNSSD